MIRRILSACLILTALGVAVPSVSAEYVPLRTVVTKECTVYVTRTGAKYHQRSCSYLRNSRRAMSRSEAITAGYTPCKRCGGRCG